MVKALDLMRTKTGIQQCFRLYLDKIVPMQAGLGGGSSNAATVMHGFNVLCGYPASQEDLLLWSGDIGSDKSFFFSSGVRFSNFLNPSCVNNFILDCLLYWSW